MDNPYTDSDNAFIAQFVSAFFDTTGMEPTKEAANTFVAGMVAGSSLHHVRKPDVSPREITDKVKEFFTLMNEEVTPDQPTK